ncbi:hypothetical protein PLESTF_000035000 [Pleodorina starrii]|nr:hypothetical protein PLESTF_000035000 [Pleodorina starrii]
MQQDAERAARMQSMLRLNLGIRDGSANVYWKHDGERFAGKSKHDIKATDWRGLCSGSTLKLCTGRTYQLTLTSSRPVRLRTGSGRWEVKEIDSEGRELQPQFEVLPPPPHPAPPLPLSAPQSHQPPPPQPQPHAALSPAPPPDLLTGDWPAEPRPSSGGGGGDLSTDPRVIRWVDASTDAARSTYTAALPVSLAPTAAMRRQYLLVEAYVEDFGLVVCPLQIKVYKPGDKNALSSFPLRFVQFDFREDSSSVGALFAVNYYKY